MGWAETKVVIRFGCWIIVGYFRYRFIEISVGMRMGSDVKGKNVLVLGLGISGRSAAQFLLKRGAYVSGVDQSQDLLNKNEEVQLLKKQGLKTFHDKEPQDLSNFDLIAVSPGVPQTHPLYAAAIEKKVEIIGEVGG